MLVVVEMGGGDGEAREKKGDGERRDGSGDGELLKVQIQVD